MRSFLLQQYQQCREYTITLVQTLFDGHQPQWFYTQIHPSFSPIGWHLGHIIYTQELWLLRKTAGYPPVHGQEYDRLFAADGLPKAQRQCLPSFEWLVDYGQTVAEKICHYWHSLNLWEMQQQEKLWYWVIQHECQHYETIYFLLHLAGMVAPAPALLISPDPASAPLHVPSGSVLMGSNSIWAMDNESSPHQIDIPEFTIDRAPVCRSQFQEFITAGGYSQPALWTEAGWQWVQTHQIQAPQYWSYLSNDRSIVYGLSWYEAHAYSQFVGKQLPSEAQWEKACQTYPHLAQEFLGVVWQWTRSYFSAYPDFCPYPYQGYSSSYFDDRHMVLRGGSWVTLPWVLRPSFRNWYTPDTRVILAGLRCVQCH